MIPLRSSERVYSHTVVTGALIAINVVIFLYQNTLSYYRLNQFVSNWGIVPDDLHLISLLTAMFLHGGWLHLLGNMLFLWVFGNNVEDRMGRARFLLFYLACGYAATYVFSFADPSSTATLVGASGAIAGVLGAYLVMFPRARVVSLLPFLFFVPCPLPAWLVLGSWFLLQWLYATGTGLTAGGVAYLAHVAGFVVGLLLVNVVVPHRSRAAPGRRW